MIGDRNKEQIGKFANDAVLYRLFNRAGAKYYTIEEKGVELYSIEESNDEPMRMIEFYCDSRRTRYRGGIE